MPITLRFNKYYRGFWCAYVVMQSRRNYSFEREKCKRDHKCPKHIFNITLKYKGKFYLMFVFIILKFTTSMLWGNIEKTHLKKNDRITAIETENNIISR